MDHESDSKRASTLGRYAIMDTPPEAVFDHLVDEASLLLGTSMSTITLIDDRRQWFKAKVGVSRDGGPIAESICAVAVQQADPLVVPDARTDPRFRDMPGVTQDGVRFYAGVPLTMRDGTRIGTICVIDRQARDGLDAEERQALEALGRRTVAAMELRRDLHEDGQRSPTRAVWLDRARSLLEQGAAALLQVGETATLARLEGVIAMLGEAQLRSPRAGGVTR